ncbi:uncharacterized protein LOC128869404 [Anastrepha ludens]|uniref:uncharacterized protein LOC128869404 n=1 Tax=Anastrepha ludens TaxID=28586 RepID=UPI0023B12402|nr:uncharacterized protein LOC128869404 [Anastrepha ludens]
MDKFVVKKPRAAVEEEIGVEEEIDVEEEIEVEENIYENETETLKRNRKFRVEWLKKFPWLENKSGTAFCKACNKSAVNILSHLNRHANCSTHLQNMESRRSQISMDSFLDAKTEQMSKMVKNAELTIVMFLIAHNLPFLLMDVFPDLLTECCPDSEVAKRLKCARTKATKITEDISNATTKDLISKLKSCKFSIIIDETTDVSTKKCLVLVVRYVASFIVRDRFLALIELPKCDASSVFEVLKNFFHNNNIPLKNIIGLATDGANIKSN